MTIKAFEDTIKTTFPNANLDDRIISANSQFPRAMGANIPKDFSGFNPVKDKGLMDTIYPWWWEEREWPRRAVITEWFYNPLKGQPRYANIEQLRYLARSEWISMCTQCIRREIASTPWEVVPKDPKLVNQPPSSIQHDVDYVTFFLNSCNPNKETIESIITMAIQDVLELDAGVITKGKGPL